MEESQQAFSLLRCVQVHESRGRDGKGRVSAGSTWVKNGRESYVQVRLEESKVQVERSGGGAQFNAQTSAETVFTDTVKA